jgi:hypothetical protein
MDLHIHSCLSPCADNAMVPARVLAWAREAGLDAVGICDHNTAGNVAAFREAGRRAGIVVLGGMEITSAEEIHLLALLDDAGSLSRLERIVAGHLPGENRPEVFGDQIVVDPDGEPIGLEERLLSGATDLPLSALVALVHRLGGLAIASHVDRPSFSVVSQLGFVPADLDLDAVELAPCIGGRGREPGRDGAQKLRDGAQKLRAYGFATLASSDAHSPEEVGRSRTRVRAARASVAELRRALAGWGGRAVLGHRFGL